MSIKKPFAFNNRFHNYYNSVSSSLSFFENFLNDPIELKEKLTEFGSWGKLILVAAMAIQVIFVFYQVK